ncbi:MAG: CocE/NonD family hydrolase, partial [Acidobacteriota bacterium]
MLKKTGIALLAAAGIALSAKGAGAPYRVREEIRVEAVMRDGVSLVADIFRPEAEGQFPVLLERTPYNRKGGTGEGRTLAAHGYVVVIQDTRGRYGSGGDFYPFLNEINDGYDTVEWAARLPASNGQVGMFGGSYVGATQMLASISRPPHLVAVFPYVTASEYYDGWTYQSGALMQWFNQSWTSGLARDTLRRKVMARPKDWIWTLPVEDYPLLEWPRAAELAPYLQDWLAHETEDAYWKRWKISDHYAELNLKALHAGGWHDIFLKGTLTNYMGLRSSAQTPEARQSQRLMIGPWAHAQTSPEGKVGGVVFGEEAVLDMTEAIAEWSDWALKGISNAYASQPPVRLFIMGENRWRYEEAFPIERRKLTRYYLHAA